MAEGKDIRMGWIESRVRTAFEHIPEAKFQKSFQTDDNTQCVKDFIEDGTKSSLLVHTDNIICTTDLKKLGSKGKAVLFIRNIDSTKPLSQQISDELLVQELTDPMAQLERIAQDIYLPILSNPRNQEGWGEVASKEIVHSLHDFIASVSVTLGHTKGQTTLPMPAVDFEEANLTQNRKLMSLLEGAVVTWTKQIKTVLKMDPETMLKRGENPTPDQELLFWQNKSEHLNSIFKQLQTPSVRKVLRALDQAKSTYCTAFARLCKEMFTARMEANDNQKYLRTLTRWFEELNGGVPFVEMKGTFKPMLHVILLIWKNSRHYNVPARLSVLMREICNALIAQARAYVTADQLFEQIENETPDLSIEQLQRTLSICKDFKETFEEYRQTTDTECPNNPWVMNSALFLRLDAFVDRTNDVLDLVQTIVQFTKLASIEVGGTKGKVLTETVAQVYAAFQDSVAQMQDVEYDIMDVSARQFDDDFYDFRCKVKELERRLGALIIQSFDDSNNLMARFKLLDSFDELVYRPIIQNDLQKCNLHLLAEFHEELKHVQEFFLQNRDDPVVSWNLPPIVGALYWCRGLVDRISEPMVRLQKLDAELLAREESMEMFKLFGTIMESLTEFEHSKIEEWGRDIDQVSQAKLKLPLLKRDKATRLLRVNFDPTLTKLLREVKYFLLCGIAVPENILGIFQKTEEFRQYTGNLDIIVDTYNSMLTSLLPVETPLMRAHIEKFDRICEEGIARLNWRSENIATFGTTGADTGKITGGFIADCLESVQYAHGLLTTLQSNLSAIQATLETFKQQPILERKSKPISPSDFESTQKARRQAVYAEIKDGAAAIHKLVKASNDVLKVSSGAPDWRSYVEFVNNIVVEGLAAVVRLSLSHLHDQVDPANIHATGLSAMLEIELLLKPRTHSGGGDGNGGGGNGVLFKPEIASTEDGRGIRDIVSGWVSSFYHVGIVFKRLDRDGTYSRELNQDIQNRMLLSSIQARLSETEAECLHHRAEYEEYSYLWETDMRASFATFVDDAVLDPADHHGVENVADLAKFDEAINKYETVSQSIDRMASPADIGWLRVNSDPIKQAMSTWATKWRYQYCSYLQQYIEGRLASLDAFMVEVGRGLDTKVVEEEDVERREAALVKVMTHIRDVRKAMGSTTAMFGPLRETLQLLKQHGVAMEDSQVAGLSAQDYLESAPLKWEAVVGKMFKMKEEILPLQTAKVEVIKEKLEGFFLAMRAFRNDFRKNAPFNLPDCSPDEARTMLEGHARDLAVKVDEVAKYNEQEELFELQVSKYPETTDTGNELRLLKSLWDFKGMIMQTFATWNKELWTAIDTESLEDATKAILKQIRKQGNDNQIIKGWGVFRDIEGLVKNMAVVLPLVNDLHSLSMRPRHWNTLARTCGVDKIDPADPAFALSDLLSLNVHMYVDDVEEVVETANKELKIEKKLVVIEDAWAGLTLDYVPHKESEISLPRPSEEVMESLEAHQLELQGMIGMGKFVDYFRDRVLGWQRTLGEVESVLKEWVAVSRSWAALESIFLASADIRSQLPDDTKRFEGIDSEFKDLMKETVNVSNVVDACTADGREDQLKDMLKRLELCQKSLNEYLDVKKKIFPRFYFVSNVALLEILSNGNNPPKIMPFLGDCYDSLADLVMPEGVTTEGTAMVAKDGERIPFEDGQSFVMTGAVEHWLNQLTVKMNDTLRFQLDRAIEQAVNWEVEKPRHKWLFDFPAQIVLNGTQIYWTEETEMSLEELEGGQEDAVKRYLNTCNVRLNHLIQLVLGKLSKPDRTKIIALITMDVHARDVVQKLIDTKTQSPTAFLWQQQLRFYWQQESRDVNIKITDYNCKYFYEWVGNTGRLVITPLTDRCYITLTMALRLYLGGAPAGPAGTGKTETTKDLARALALPCYVFNCSDQMNYQTMADIFRGLCQTGSWGCFDEFNRIPIEVLSVVATQVKTIQDQVVHYAVPANRDDQFQHLSAGTPPNKVGEFDFMGDTISLIPTCGFFITMNPGYAGRTELPENLKVLFRSCAMIRPDLKPICENMLMSEGFLTARGLAIKFVTLYQLGSELLSPQPHYDWGLRAVKSVLRVAGNLKRASPELDEDKVLMRALRDFNIPKFPSHDIPVFLRLIADLFIGIEVDAVIDQSLREKTVAVSKARGLQHDESFVLKVTQYQELLDVRHSVMLLGPAGCAKSTIWSVLAGCHNLNKPKPTCVFETVNPKSVTSDELYGYMTLSKDWRDGVLSIIMRGMSKCYAEQGFHEYQTYKWVVLDGDIDAVWIESMNTVMDDNKVLTLVSNERIPLSAAMRMVFEINSLKNATPATVSRAGILYINEADIGWRPFTESWVARREEEIERTYLPGMFDKYIEATVEIVRKGYKRATPVRVINMVSTICYLLEGLLDGVPAEKLTQEAIESFFVFACTWAFGGALIVDKSGDYRRNFHDAFESAFTTVKYPKEGTCFDYYYDFNSNEFQHWQGKVPEYVPVNIGAGAGETTFNNLVVSTVDSVRMTFLLDTLVKRRRHVMFVGGAGTGKTTVIKDYLRNVDENWMKSVISMNYFTDSAALQQQLESVIDKRSGRMFGPPSTKRLIYFLDDLNLPYVEEYGTQNSLALLQQHMSHSTIFDRTDLGFRKEIVDVQYAAAMNPTAGSFEVCERNQRHFATFACMMPSNSDLASIYQSIFDGHLLGFDKKVAAMSEALTAASISLFNQVAVAFLPSAVKFVYNWNMRELSNIYQGLCLSDKESYHAPVDIVRLWVHEAERVFQDRMLNEEECAKFQGILEGVIKKEVTPADPSGSSSSGALAPEAVLARPVITTNFANSNSGDYLPVADWEGLNKVLSDRLAEYNESNSIMDLVLFQDAMTHVTRINRIISNPGGNAMLIGVGGSGKQSLSRLAAFIGGMETKQLSVTSNFKVDDLKEALRDIYTLAGVKGVPMILLMTDSQIVNEQFLVYINNILSSGWIPDLFARDEVDGLLGGIRNEAKANGIVDTPETMMAFLVDRCRQFLHVVLCFSPVGETFRVRARRFPGLVNCTAIDWFHAWPEEALVSVANKFVADLDLGTPEVKSAIATHMSVVHLSVTQASKNYLTSQRRYNYVTPKSFLELISFYKLLLESKRAEVQHQIDRLDVGLSTLRKTAADVAELQVDLAHTMEKVAEKVAATEILIADMGVQKEAAEKQQAAARVEEGKANEASANAAEIEVSAERELSAAKPAMEAASAAVDVLNKNMLTELKNLGKPPAGVDKVTTCCLIMVEREYKNHKWDRAKKMMAKVDKFKETLQAYRGEDIPEEVIERIEPIIKDPEFTYENMSTKSAAAANLCNWVINIYTFNRIYVRVKPLMDSLEAARATKAAAEAKLATVQAAVAEVEQQLQQLEETFTQATKDKAEVEAEAERCTAKIGLAGRLVGGLSSENERWGIEIDKLRLKAVTLLGDVLLAAAFVSYVGAFDQDNRQLLWRDTWLVDIINQKIPFTEGVDPLDMLTNDGKSAQMMSEGLPSDRISIENGSIITNCKRWPLIIDPQLQGIKWLRKREEENNLVVMQLTMNRWLQSVENAITNGFTVIIENLGDEIDATLDPVLGRQIYRKGRNLYLRLGGEEVEYDENFQLYLQTKLSNPHYKPEIAAQCTLINFIATEAGLEDQLLAKVVKEEQPAMEAQKQELVAAFQQYKIQLVELEDNLLERLANAPDDILSDVALIEGLEETKAAVTQIKIAVEKGKETEIQINAARESYRLVAAEGAMLYFMLTQLYSIDHMYQYSLDAFVTFFYKAIATTPAAEKQEQRVLNLRETLRLTIFTWVSRGLFEAHKLVFLAQLAFNLIKRRVLPEEVDDTQFQFLLRGPKKIVDENPLAWLPDASWYGVQALGDIDGFDKFPSDMREAGPRFHEWYNHVTPETEKLPLDWSGLDKTPFLKMLVIRCLRPDRMTIALANFVTAVLPNGESYARCDQSLNSKQILDQSLGDSTPFTPLYFILSPGADVVGDLDSLTGKYEMEKGVSYHNVSMGQGQDVVAMDKLEQAHRNGHWVILNNIHLMPRWLIDLEKKLDEFALEGSHARYRLFLTSDPSTGIPIGLLNRSIKLTNAPPAGLKANLNRAFCSFSKEYVEELDSKTRSILFGLCHFHAIMMERKMYGPLGYNMMYPFSLGDLRDSTVCLTNYMESNGGGKIPWEDLKYLFGEIMYGGHIVNDFDRLMCNTYLDFYMKDGLLEETELYPYVEDEKASFKSPVPTTYERYLEHINTEITTDTPVAFGLHPNAEIDFRTQQSDSMFAILMELQPRDGGGGDGGSNSPQSVAEAQVAKVMEGGIGEKVYDLEDIVRSLEEQGPYQNVFVQEIDLVGVLLTEMKRSLKELSLGFAGELTMSDSMEDMMNALFLDKVPGGWTKKAWPSLRPLAGWLHNLTRRLGQLDDWVQNPMEIPRVTWISGLINPQSFLTAICQVTAQRNQLELDKLMVNTEVTKRYAGAVDAASRDGAFIEGLSVQGARWDLANGVLDKAKPKEMFFPMPVMNCKAVAADTSDKGSIYQCPTYKTEQRGPTFVFLAQLKTKSMPGRWVLAGVALLMDVV